MAVKKHLQHVRSAQYRIAIGRPHPIAIPPSSGDIKHGEIAINYHKGCERMYIRNDENEIESFLNETGTASMIQDLRDEIYDLHPVNLWNGDGGYAVIGGSGTVATGDFSFAHGQDTSASGQASHAEGSGTTSNGNYSHAEGHATSAIGIASHAEGVSATSNGNYSHAEGEGTSAFGANSHAEGFHTIATNSNEHASGKYNRSGVTGGTVHTILSVGVGSSETDRRNGLEVLSDGSVQVYKSGTGDSTVYYNLVNTLDSKAGYKSFSTYAEMTNYTGVTDGMLCYIQRETAYYIYNQSESMFSPVGKAYEFDNQPTSGSNNLLTSGTIYNTIGDINTILDSING